jgi:hypothetical protein
MVVTERSSLNASLWSSVFNRWYVFVKLQTSNLLSGMDCRSSSMKRPSQSFRNVSCVKASCNLPLLVWEIEFISSKCAGVPLVRLLIMLFFTAEDEIYQEALLAVIHFI